MTWQNTEYKPISRDENERESKATKNTLQIRVFD